jgi:hypothetical protein
MHGCITYLESHEKRANAFRHGKYAALAGDPPEDTRNTDYMDGWRLGYLQWKQRMEEGTPAKEG